MRSVVVIGSVKSGFFNYDTLFIFNLMLSKANRIFNFKEYTYLSTVLFKKELLLQEIESYPCTVN